MKTWPALDILDGRVVQLEGGNPDRVHVSLADPLEVAQHWARLGFHRLHVIDLDSALGRGSQMDFLLKIRSACSCELQVGGGFRSTSRVEAALAAGIERVILGSQAVKDPEWAHELVARFPGRIVIAVETRDGRVQTHGWTQDADVSVTEFMAGFEGAPIAAFLHTDVDREGRLGGFDGNWVRKLRDATTQPICLSGGIRGVDDIREAAELGIDEVIAGTALYSGALDPVALLKENTA